MAIPFRPAAQTPSVIRFGLIGIFGIAVNQFALVALTEVFGVWYAVSAVIATQLSSSFNFVGSERWAFAGRRSSGGVARRYLTFMGISNATLLIRIPVLFLLTEFLGVGYAVSNLITLLSLFVVRYALADKWIWRAVADPESSVKVEKNASKGVAASEPHLARFRYDIAGIVRIHSDVILRELEYFRTEWNGAPDIRITIGRVGTMPIRRAQFEQVGDQLSYREHLGAAGANFAITLGEPIEVRAAPLLAMSPHVLYTNVIEALLRFHLVSKGYVLLHSACMEVDGKAVLLSAQTDTGKTSTVIKLVRERGYRFLSDDMTIISPDGYAISYPKPMTLSYHTMQAINEGELPIRERAALAVQSRLHSKSGRSVGHGLGRLNLPIMSVNSAVQMMIPPPKYHISSLIECEIGERAPIGHVFLMERGEPMREELTVSAAIGQLIENTDDAYGFPPFSTFAPHLRIGDADYPELRRQEHELLERALQAARIWRLRVVGHEWAELLPSLIGEPAQDGPVVALPVGGDGREPMPIGEPFADEPAAVSAPDAAAAVDALVGAHLQEGGPGER